jgi:hypothetical protein
MIVSFFSRGTGGGRGPVEYLLGEDHDRELAELLRGDALETIALIDSSPYAKKYTSGCLSFEEADLTPELKRQLMDSFEETIFPGLHKNQYNILWVEHRDKGRLELNFVIPNIELTTGRRLQPYFYKADEKRVDAWKTIQNIENGFSDPDDPARRQALTPASDLPASSKAIADDLHAGIESMIASGQIENRGDIVAALEAAGFTMARQTKTFISIENPDGGRNIRLKGGVYERDFDISKELPQQVERRSAAHQQRLGERLEAARERYSYGIEIKRAELAGSFKGQRKGYERSHPAAAKSTAVGFPLASRVAHNSSLGVDRLERLARRESAGTRAVDSAGQKDAGEPAQRLESGADRGQALLADGQRKATASGTSDRQENLVYTISSGVEKDDEPQRKTRTSANSTVQRDRPRTAEPLLGLQKGIRTYTEKFGVSGGEGQGRGRDQGQDGKSAEMRADDTGARYSLRTLQRADDRVHLSLRAIRAVGGRVDDGNRASILRHIKEVGGRLQQGFRGVAAGVAAARDRFLESCGRIVGAGVQLEQTQRTVERTSVELEYANQHVGAIIKDVEQAQQQKQREQQQAKPSRGFRL